MLFVPGRPLPPSRDCEPSFDQVAEPEALEGVKDIVLTNVRVNGTVRNERIERD